MSTHQAGLYGVGEVIKAARQRRGWGQRTLAIASGVAQPNIAAIERGTRAPSVAMVHRLVRACGLQLRYELEPPHAQVDAAVLRLLGRSPLGRIRKDGAFALLTAYRLAATGLRLVVDGPLAARLCGAPVVDRPERVWCDHAALPQLREAALRCHFDLRPVRPRYDKDGRVTVAEGDQVWVGPCLVTLGTPPPARWAIEQYGGLLVVGVEQLLGYPDWEPGDRIAVRRLLTVLAERGEAAHGLDSAG